MIVIKLRRLKKVERCCSDCQDGEIEVPSQPDRVPNPAFDVPTNQPAIYELAYGQPQKRSRAYKTVAMVQNIRAWKRDSA